MTQKIISVKKEQTDIERIQKELDVAGDWCTTSVMRLNVDKCKLLHLLHPKAN